MGIIQRKGRREWLLSAAICGVLSALSPAHADEIVPQTYQAEPSAKPGAQMQLPPLPDTKETEELRRKQDVKDNAEAFKVVLKTLMSMSPDEIRALHESLDGTQRAAATSGPNRPKPKQTQLDVAIKPGNGNPMLALYKDYVTPISVFDVTGHPWPIDKVVNGNPTDFTIDKPVDDAHYIYVRPNTMYAQGNAVIYLKGYSMPLVIDLAAGTSDLNSSVRLRLASRGPASPPPSAEAGMPIVGDAVLNNFLHGIPPASADELRVTGMTGQAWRYNSHLYIKSRNIVRSPGCIQYSVDDDATGMNICELPDVPLVIVSENGKTVNVTLDITPDTGSTKERGL